MTKRVTLLDDMTDDQRKAVPIAEMLTEYFPDALIEVARMCYIGQRQHNPKKPLGWDKSKSSDHRNTLLRHFFQAGTVDTDGERHSSKVAWRALARLQIEIEAEREAAAKVARAKARRRRRVGKGRPAAKRSTRRR